MKAKTNDAVRTLVDIGSDFHPDTIPAGTEGCVIEVYENPEGYCVDLRIPDPSLVGGARYENLILKPNQFELIDPVK